MKFFYSLLFLILAVSCNSSRNTSGTNEDLDVIANKYVQIGLYIGKYDSDFVDAYYGPESLQPLATNPVFPKDSLLGAVKILSASLNPFLKNNADELQKKRVTWMKQQLTAFEERIRIYTGETRSFDEEAKALFGVKPPHYPDEHYQSLLKELDKLMPGTGPLPERMQAFNKKFIIPKDKVDTVFRTAIAEARRRTKLYYTLPADETFELEYVTGKSWSGYNWYKGNYKSLIQISNDVPLFIERAIDLACHEGYPGHHVYNMLLEQNLYKDKGWVEISLYPLYSPQSLIAEGSANYGIQMAFPGKEREDYLKNVLLPLAGLDTTNAGTYLRSLEIMRKLNFLRNEVASQMFAKQINEQQAEDKLINIGLMSKTSAGRSVQFIKKYRSYVLNYNYGLQLVTEYIEKGNPSKEERWQRFYKLLSNPVTTNDLLQ